MAPSADAREFSSSPAQAPTYWDGPPMGPCIRSEEGPALGDEGSGYWIGQEALRACFWAKDRGIATTLLTEIADLWGTKSLGEIVEMANERPGPDLPALTPLVARCADAGDELALAVSNAPVSSWPSRSPSSR